MIAINKQIVSFVQSERPLLHLEAGNGNHCKIEKIDSVEKLTIFSFSEFLSFFALAQFLPDNPSHIIHCLPIQLHIFEYLWALEKFQFLASDLFLALSSFCSVNEPEARTVETKSFE